MAEKRAKKCEEAAGGGGSWALSYGDLMTLLLTFFVLIVSFSTTELIKFRKAMGSLRGSMGVLLEQDGASIIEKQTRSASPNESMQSQMLKQQMDALEETIFSMELDQGVSIERKEGGLLFRLQSSLVFESGSTEVSPLLYPLLDRIGLILLLFGRDIKVEGHTDSLPVSRTGRFSSNWELSTARALSVAQYFIEEVHIDPMRLVIAGRGHWKPVAANDSYENRAKNRRVEILVEIDEYKTE